MVSVNIINMSRDRSYVLYTGGSFNNDSINVLPSILKRTPSWFSTINLGVIWCNTAYQKYM